MEKTAVRVKIGLKEIILRDPNNADIENAMKITGQQMGGVDDRYRYMFKMQQNLIKEVLISVNGDSDVRKPLEDMFTMAEISVIQKVISEISGMGNELSFTQEIITL